MFQSLKIYLSILFMTVAYPVFSFQNPLDLYDFSASETSGSWIIANDGVMGGFSRSQLSLRSTGTLLFQGSVSTRLWWWIPISEIRFRDFRSRKLQRVPNHVERGMEKHINFGCGNRNSLME